MVTVMYAPDDLRVMGVCDGPAPDGRCPRTAVGDEVFCRGLDLVLSGDDARRDPATEGRPRMRVPAGTTVCPLLKGNCRRDYFNPFTPRS